MSCERYEEMIALAAGGDLDAGDARRLDHHLSSCAGCRSFAEEMRHSQRAVRELARSPIGDEVLARVRAGVLARMAEEPAARGAVFRGPAYRVPPRWLAAAAVLLVVLGAAVWRLGPGGPAVEAPSAPRIADAADPVRDEARIAEPPIAEPHIAEPHIAEPRIEEPVVEPPGTAAPEPEPTEHQSSRAVVADLETGRGSEPRPEPANEAGEVQSRPTIAALPSPEVATATPEVPPVVIHWVTDDPDVVIYWLVDTEPTTEETEHEISKV